MFRTLKNIFFCKKAEITPGSLITIVIAIAVTVLIASALMPSAMDNLYDTETGGWGTPPFGTNYTYNATDDSWGYHPGGNMAIAWVDVGVDYEDTSTSSVWWLIPLIAVIVVLLLFVGAIVILSKD